jgi:hypothetical protein
MTDKPYTLLLSRREHATILAALRYYQSGGTADRSDIVEIATCGDDFSPMTVDEIDDLCMEINQ